MKIPKNLEEQFAKLKSKFPTAKFIPNSKNIGTIYIKDFKLPDGWNKDKVDVHFDIPIGFPAACPNDFYVSELDLRTKRGIIPRNTQHLFTGFSNVASFRMLYFYWRLLAWSPNSDTLLTYVRVIQARFAEAV